MSILMHPLIPWKLALGQILLATTAAGEAEEDRVRKALVRIKYKEARVKSDLARKQRRAIVARRRDD